MITGMPAASKAALQVTKSRNKTQDLAFANFSVRGSIGQPRAVAGHQALNQWKPPNSNACLTVPALPHAPAHAQNLP